jgi:hypothetical protein
MPRKPKLNSIKNEFERVTMSATNLTAAVYKYAQKQNTWDGIQGYEPLHPAQAQKVFALAFMQIVVAWEQFIQDCFIRYMIGASSPSGYSPLLRSGKCENLLHAGQIITGKIDYDPEKDIISWSSWKIITDRAKIYFKDGHPFTLLRQPETQRLSDAIAMRNRVAHNSNKSKELFKKIAREHLRLPSDGKLRPGYGIGELLVSPPLLFSQPYDPNIYYWAYAKLFLDMASVIAP